MQKKQTGFIKSIFFIFFSFCIIQVSAQDTIFYESFEAGVKPVGWSELKVKGTPPPHDNMVPWVFLKGGRDAHPPTSAIGNKNAVFNYQSYNRESTKFITPPINLQNKVKPMLTFWHVQSTWYWGAHPYFVPYWDELKVFYKTSEEGQWHLLAEYPIAVEDWTKRYILLPDAALVSTLYIGFEGTTGYGNGTCIDEVIVHETDVAPRQVNTIQISQASTEFVASGITDNPILRVDINVKGNSNDLYFNKLTVHSLCDNVQDIAANGVKLYYTPDTLFNMNNQLAVSTTLSGDSAIFNFSYSLPTGNSTFWVTYDLSGEAIPGNKVDAMIKRNRIKIGPGYFPAQDNSPIGSRVIYETIFFDDFETNKGWTLKGDFERNKPLGLGGNYTSKTWGAPDPLFAFSGDTVIGTDLTGLGTYLGNFELNLSDVEDFSFAITPTFDFKYFKDVTLRYMRQLNVYFFDYAYLDYTTDNGQTWVNIWKNSNEGGSISETSWRLKVLSLRDVIDRKSNVKFRYGLGPTGALESASGWNIDDFLLTGDFISTDVGVSRIIGPIEGCGFTDQEEVQVVVRNYGALPTPGKIPIAYSLDRISWVVDTLYAVISPDDSLEFTFAQKLNLSNPNIYPNFTVKTILVQDQDKRNDSITQPLYSFPLITLPYSDDFENPLSFWRAKGKNHTWQLGKPDGYRLVVAASGVRAWKTKLDGFYTDEDSSFVESPCFDLSGVLHPVFEFKFWNETEPDKDGAAVHYSVDGGENWQIVPRHSYSEWDWNWYNKEMIAALGTAGWDTVTNNYILAKQFLPLDIAGQPNVKFRIAFASDTAATYEGFAFDDVRIYDAPHDLGVVSIDSIFPLACQYVNDEYLSLAVKNFGVRAVKPGEKVRLAVRLDNGPVITDTITMLQSIPVNDTLVIKLTKPVDFTAPGNYLLKAWAIDDRPGFYAPNPVNDTSSLALTIVPLPVLDLGDTIFTARPDTVVIRPPFDPDFEYLWQDGFTGPEYQVSKAGRYSVTVTHTVTHCEATDSLVIVQLIADYGVSKVISPASSCFLGSEVYFEVEFHNAGTDTLKAGKGLPVGFVLHETQVFRDTLIMTSDFVPGESRALTLDVPLDMTLVQEYSFKFFTAFPWDSIPSNDSLAYDIEVYGFPGISLGPDTVVKGQDFYILDPGQGYASYLWQDGAETSTYAARGIGTYWVRVTDTNGCSSSDTVFVHLVIHDVSPVLLVSPVNSCDPQGLVYPKVLVVNTGTDTLSIGEIIPLKFKWNEGAYYLDTLTLTQELRPNDGIIHTFDQAVDISQVGKDTLIVITSIDGDIRAQNDTLRTIVEVYPKPVLDLGANIVGLEALEYLIQAPLGFEEYLWHNSSNESHFLVNRASKTFDNRYTLTVTDANGCKATDNKLVSLAIRDLEVTSISFPAEICQLTSTEQITVRVTNKGTLPLSNVQVRMSYKANTEPVREQVFTYTGDAGTSRLFTFNQTADLSAQTSHSIKAYLMGLFSLDTEGNPVPMTELDPSNDTLVQAVTVLGNPVINFGESGGKLVVALPYILDPAPGYAAYLWQDNSQLPTYNVTNEGTYTVRVTSTAGCVSEKSVIVERIVGISTAGTGKALLYPNPATDRIWLQLDQDITSHLIMEIVNSSGSVVQIDQIPAGSDSLVPVSLDNYPPGMYYLKVYNHDVIYTAKFVVK